MNAFEILGIEPRLVISEEEIRTAFREAGKLAHPDVGGGEGEFATLKKALEIVSSPSKRLRHWLELRGIEVEIRGAIGPDLMNLFSEIAGITQRAETSIRKREEARSALAKALLENEIQSSRDQVESAIVTVNAAIDRTCVGFLEMQTDLSLAGQVVRDLAFLEKWRAGLRGAYSRLV